MTAATGKILVFGKTGQVARELQRQADVVALDRAAADLTEPEACARVILASGATAVINAAAYTAVDRAEEDEATAQVVNGVAPGAMARACATRGIPFVHISTDYVFDGTGTAPWRSDSPAGPLGAYGRSKRAGEVAVAEAGGVHAILRTSWVFSAHGANFVKTMLRLGAERDSLTVVCDQIGGPTAAADIAAACRAMVRTLRARPDLAGIYHFSGAPDVSWADFARAIFAQASLPCVVRDISSAEYPQKAHRPGNSRLDCSGLQAAFGIARPDWRISLRHVLHDLKGVSS